MIKTVSMMEDERLRYNSSTVLNNIYVNICKC